MATENLFSTKREGTLTGSQMLENVINQKAAQRKNMIALTEARKLSQNAPDFVATMESANLEADNKLKTNAMLENAQYHQGARNIARQQLQMKQRLTMEGMELVKNKVLGEIIYESYWLDEPVKESTVEQIGESIGKVLSYVEENFNSSKVPESKQSRLMQSVNEAISGVVKEAVERLVTEAKEANDAFTEFGLTEEEENKLDDKLCDLGKDEIVDIIKNKVAQVVQDEKEKGEEKSKMFDEIEQTLQQNDESPDDTDDEPMTDTEEATLNGIYSGEITLEGANWTTLKIYFSDLRKRASKYCKEANKLYKQGRYDDAEKKYAECKDIFEDIKKRLVDVEDSMASVAISYFTAYFTSFVAFVDVINTRGGASTVDISNAHKDAGGTWNTTRQYVIANVNRMITWCDNQINLCKKNSKEEKTGKGREYKYSLESVLKATPNKGYTSSENYILNIMESGAAINLFEDPSWSEFKSYVSMISKKIRDTLIIKKYNEAVVLIDELEKRLSNVPENIPADVRSFVLTMTNIIYGAIPNNDVIISRLDKYMGSPGMSQSHEVDMMTISWIDILVNIKTNLASIRDYCVEKVSSNVIDDEGVGNACISGRDALASLIATKQSRTMTQNIGGSLFEALMLSNLSATTKIVQESNSPVSNDDVEDAALIESLLQYTVLETLDTLGIYKFRLADVNSMKRACISSISEGTTPVYGDSDKDTVSMGNDNSGKKVVRINTRKMKRKEMSNS